MRATTTYERAEDVLGKRLPPNTARMALPWIRHAREQTPDIEPFMSRDWEKPKVRDLILALVSRDYEHSMPAEYRSGKPEHPPTLAELSQKWPTEHERFDDMTGLTLQHHPNHPVAAMNELEEVTKSLENFEATLSIFKAIQSRRPVQPSMLKNLFVRLATHQFDMSGEEYKMVEEHARQGVAQLIEALGWGVRLNISEDGGVRR